MKTFNAVVFASMASSAMAFAPSSVTESASTTLKAMPDRLWNTMVDPTERSKSLPFLPRPINLDGTAPGDVGFDPFYLSSIPKDFSGFLQPPSWEDKPSTLPTLYWMREAEIKHGRIAMMAVLGWIATDLGVRFPAEQFSVANVPTAYDAHNIFVSQGSMGVGLLAIGLIEISTGSVLVQVSKGEIDREPGDFKFGHDYYSSKSEEEVKLIKTKEINNGRIAMLAFGGIATQTALGDQFHAFPYF